MRVDFSAEGRVTITHRTPTGTKVYKQSNLLLAGYFQRGLQRALGLINRHVLYRCRIGTGDTLPSTLDNALAGDELANSISSTEIYPFQITREEGVTTASYGREWVFPAGTGTGTIAEITLQTDSSTSIYSFWADTWVARIVLAEPIVKGEADEVDVGWELFIHKPEEWVTTLGGTTCVFTMNDAEFYAFTHGGEATSSLHRNRNSLANWVDPVLVDAGTSIIPKVLVGTSNMPSDLVVDPINTIKGDLLLEKDSWFFNSWSYAPLSEEIYTVTITHTLQTVDFFSSEVGEIVLGCGSSLARGFGRFTFSPKLVKSDTDRLEIEFTIGIRPVVHLLTVEGYAKELGTETSLPGVGIGALPLVGAYAHLGGFGEVADAQGKASFSLPSGGYMGLVESPGFKLGQTPFQLPEDSSFDVFVEATGCPTLFLSTSFMVRVASASVSLSIPAGTEVGDLILVQMFTSAARDVTPPTGFTQFMRYSTSTASDFRPTMWGFYKIAEEADLGATYSWGTGTTITTNWVVSRVEGVDTIAPIGSMAGGNSGISAPTSQVLPSITPEKDNSLWFGGIAGYRTEMTVMSIPEGSIQIRYEPQAWSPGILVFDYIESLDPTGTKDFSWTGANRIAYGIFEVRGAD